MVNLFSYNATFLLCWLCLLQTEIHHYCICDDFCSYLWIMCCWFMRQKEVVPHLSWQQRPGRTRQGRHSKVLSIPSDSGRSRRSLSESRSRRWNSAPGCTGSQSSAYKKKKEKEGLGLAVKVAQTEGHCIQPPSFLDILVGHICLCQAFFNIWRVMTEDHFFYFTSCKC